MFIFVEDLMFGFGMPIHLMDKIMWKTSQNIDLHFKAEMKITYIKIRKTAPKSLLERKFHEHQGNISIKFANNLP